MLRKFECATCGQWHEDMPLCFGQPAPALLLSMPESERESRGLLSSDQCIVDGNAFFVLGRLEIPIHGLADNFTWLVWVSLSESNFERASELWNQPGRESEPAYFGWLSSALPYEPSTLNLKVNLHTCPIGERPYVELQESEHPLSLAQKGGMSMSEVQALVEKLLHGAP